MKRNKKIPERPTLGKKSIPLNRDAPQPRREGPPTSALQHSRDHVTHWELNSRVTATLPARHASGAQLQGGCDAAKGGEIRHLQKNRSRAFQLRYRRTVTNRELNSRVPTTLPGEEKIQRRLRLLSKYNYFRFFAVMRSYQGYYTRSHQNSEVKRLWAGIVLGWVTSREVPVLHPLFWTPKF